MCQRGRRGLEDLVTILRVVGNVEEEEYTMVHVVNTDTGEEGVQALPVGEQANMLKSPYDGEKAKNLKSPSIGTANSLRMYQAERYGTKATILNSSTTHSLYCDNLCRDSL